MLLLAVAVAGLALDAVPGADQGPVKANPPSGAVRTYETDIRPLFQAKCVRCHGDKARKADLDLRTLAGALKGGESGTAIVPGKPDESLLYEKVHAGAMPPGKPDRLSEGEVK